MKQRHERWLGFIALILLCVATACAQAPKAKNIVPPPVAAVHPHTEAIEVHVTGGGKQWRLSDQALQEAIMSALEQSRAFATAPAASGAPYRLDVVIGSVRQPPVGWNFTVEVQTIWNLSQTATQETIWQKTIEGKNTATPGDAFAAVNRLRIATERAAQDCVAQGVRELGALSW